MPSRILKDSILTDKAFNTLSLAEESIYHRLLVSADDYGNIDYLKGKEENVLCIVTVMGGPGLSVMQQLKEIGMQNVLWIHEGEDICIELPQYLDERGVQELIERFPSLMDDVVYLKKRFVQRMGYELNLDCPRTFNEKLQWLKLFDRKPIYTDMVDKAAVKKIVADRIGEQYTIQTFGVYDSFDQIDFSYS